MTKDLWAAVPNAEKMVDIMLHTPAAYAMQEAIQSPQRDLISKIHRENVEKSLTWKNFEQVWAAHPPSSERLSEIETATLFIVGTKGKAHVLKIAELFKQLPHIRFEYIENADHGLIWTHAAKIVSSIRNFLQK